jgi:hypothetical protein
VTATAGDPPGNPGAGAHLADPDTADPDTAAPDTADPDTADPDTGPVAAARPYAWTRGRTRSTRHLALETLVSPSDRGRSLEQQGEGSAEQRAVLRLCSGVRSVAEVAALLAVPLGVARVLVGDMADEGLVAVHRSAFGSHGPAHPSVYERVLCGLRRL